MQLALDRSTPFNLDYTLDCGQVFRWTKKKDNWYGIVGRTVIKVRRDDGGLVFQTFPEELETDFIKKYFRLDDDLTKIASRICKDVTIRRAMNELYGLRIVRQDPWECLISYICATFSNITRIKGMVRNLSRKFGKKISYDGSIFYTFPDSTKLAKATVEELIDCKLGYRAKYVHGAAKAIQDTQLNLEYLKRLSYFEAKTHLLTIPGVGPKVADCILLFSLDKLEAFPVDVWIRRILSKLYGQHFPDCGFLEKREITLQGYKQLNTFGREYFGEYAGYAQEYLYHYYRLNSQSKW